jgi:hypothetical protein
MPQSTTVRFLATVVAYIVVQAALSRWLTPGSGVYWVPADMVPLLVWLGFAAWGAAIVRNTVPDRWRPLAAIATFMALVVVLFIIGLFTDCVANPRGCEL